jgi:hypothetical protein
MIPASLAEYCVPAAKTTFFEGEQIPQKALGVG